MGDAVPVKAYHADDLEVSESDIIATALERGLIAEAELTRCRAIHDRQVRRAQYQPVLEILLEQGALTRSQAERIREQLRDAAQIGEIPGFQILAKAGQGAMGVVYRARQLSVDRIVAVKILSRQLGRNKEFIRILDREARLGARLSSEHIPQIIDRGEINGQHYLVMEYVEGVSVAERLEQGPRFGEKEVIDIAIPLTRALAHLHGHKIVHRDVKPGNIVITHTAGVKLMDLGLARHTGEWRRIAAEEGTAIGTPYYISPEQIRGQRDLDCRSDLYSLGATLYHMVAGQPPFQHAHSVNVLHAHLKETATPLCQTPHEISPEFSKIIERLLAKHPARRFRTPDDLLERLLALHVAATPADSAIAAAVSEGEPELAVAEAGGVSDSG